MEGDERRGIDELRRLYAARKYQEAIKHGEEVLPLEDNPRVVSEVHLMIAKCWKCLEDPKSAISSCNQAISIYSKWKEPYLFRSACFQALYSYLQNTDGDLDENIQKDRELADVIVDQNCNPTDVTEKDETEKMKQLFRKQEKRQIFVNSLSEGLRIVQNGGTIFLEKGTHRVSTRIGRDDAPYFLFGKSISIFGASSSQCILLYRCEDRGTAPEQNNSQTIETFLIASNSSEPTLIKRMTFKNENPAELDTKFIGVAGGTVQLEDCILDGSSSPAVDAAYTNSKICGTFASNYPSPYLIIRYCVFNHCAGNSGLTAVNSCLNIKCSLFIGGGSCSISGQSSSKVTVENCEFGQNELTVCAIRAVGSDVTVTGSYLHGLEAVGSTVHEGACSVVESVATISNNYFNRVGTGLRSCRTDLLCARNMFYSCSQRYSGLDRYNNNNNNVNSTPLSAVVLSGKGKVQVAENVMKHCDIGVSLSEDTNPTLRDNVLDSSFFCGVFVEKRSKPVIVHNIFNGGDPASQVPRGLGVLFITKSAGLLGKNQFQDFSVSPILVFANSHPLLKDNRFDNVSLVETKQAEIERSLIHLYETEVEEESYIYLVDSGDREEALAPAILKGTAQFNK